MKLCTETVTLYNVRYDKAKDCTVYVPTVLNGVHTHSTMHSSVSKDGLMSADTTTIRIPADVDAGGKAYTDPDGYTNAVDVSGVFTINEGDLIIPGKSVFNNVSASTLRKKHRAITVVGVTDNRHAPHAPHFKVVCT